MRSRATTFLTVSALAAGLAVEARAQSGCCGTGGGSRSVLVESTSYLAPTATAVFVPTARYYTTSATILSPTYVVRPTSYLVPTSYRTTSRLVVRRPLRGAVYEETSSTVYLPTTVTLGTPLLGSTVVEGCDPAPVDCDPTILTEPQESVVTIVPESVEDRVVAPTTPAPQGGSMSGAAPAASGGSGRDEPPLNPNVLRSTPNGAGDSNVDSPPTQAAPATSTPAIPAPTTPAATEDPGLVNPPPAAPAGDVAIPPVADAVPPPLGPAPEAANDSELEPAPSGPTAADEANRLELREARKPVAVDRVGVARSTLLGKVVSGVSGKPEAGVEVSAVDAMGRFRNRKVTTDSAGVFRIVLPEGDWTVLVPKAGSATDLIEANVTVSGGLITDGVDREVTSLTINR